MMEFLYFPEDKTAYIVPVITLLIFFAGALFAMRWIKRVSDKELSQHEERITQLKSDGSNSPHEV